MFTAYGMSESGNCYKVRLALEQLGLPYKWVEVSTTRGETRTPGFLKKNPNGQVPVLELPDGEVLAESNAILRYLPTDSPRRAELPRLHERGYKALGVMEEHLAREPYFAAGTTRSPTSRSMPIPTAPPTAASTSGAIPRSWPGSRA